MGDLYSNKAKHFHLHLTLFCLTMLVTGIGPNPIEHILLFVTSLEESVQFRRR